MASRTEILTYARRAVRDEVRKPFHGEYDRQVVADDILNQFGALTNSAEHYDLVVELIREAEGELCETN